MKVKLGKKYTDKVHGITGIATARSEYLNGCNRACIERLVNDKVESEWYDEVQLVETKSPGGPNRSVAPSRDTKR